MSWILRLYPRDWRQRYGHEVATLVAAERPSFRLYADLLAGAIDARLNPQWTPIQPTMEGDDTMNAIRSLCAVPEFSKAEQLRSAAWMIGASAILTLLGVGLDALESQSVISRAVLYSAFPAALTFSLRNTYLSVLEPAKRRIVLGVGTIGMFLFMLAVVYFASIAP